MNKKSFFELVKIIYTISEDEVINCCHKDGFLYLLFIKYLCIYFAIITFSGCGVLLPIFLYGIDSLENLIMNYTIQNALNNEWKLWIVLIFTVLYSIMGFVMLYLFHARLKFITIVENKTLIDSLCANRGLVIKNFPKNIFGEQPLDSGAVETYSVE